MKPTYLICLVVAAAGALFGLQGCAGKGFTVADDGGSGSGDGAAVGSPDATAEAAVEAGLESGPGDVTADQSTVDGASSDATSSDARPPLDGAPEASGLDAAPSNDAEWVPDAVEPPPGHCDNGFACSPAPPFGWSGPLEVYDGPSPPAACSTYFEGPIFVGGSSPTGAPATCGCSCPDAPTGVACGSVDVPFYAGLTCPSGGACAQKTFLPGVCTRSTAQSECDAGTNSMIIPLSMATGGQCTPLPTKTVAPPSWAVAARACISTLGSQASDCPAGDVCAHSPLPPYADVCIAQMGVVAACPPGAYSDRRIYTSGFNDTRDCSACTCGPVTGATCASQLDVFATTADPSQACAGAAQVTYIAPEGCSFVSEPADIRLQATLESTGSCTASPVAPTGTLLGAQPATFCCLP
jgi:hypothetical protein